MRTEHPILFSGPMVRAILDGSKTQTRRPVVLRRKRRVADLLWIRAWHQDGGGNWIAWSYDAPDLAEITLREYPAGAGVRCPYGRPGDVLWVREAFQLSCDHTLRDCGNRDHVLYREIDERYGIADTLARGWRPNIHMPRWASRITLEVVSVRVERLQDISEAEAIAEGVRSVAVALDGSARAAFRTLWDAINAKRGYGWDANPWVWVNEFKRLEP